MARRQRTRAAVKRLGIVAPGLLPKLDVEVRHRLYERTSPLPNPHEQRGWSVVVSYDMPLGGALLPGLGMAEQLAAAPR